MSKPIKVLLSAGGTGGHMFPAVALAQELRRRGGFELALATDARGLAFVPADLDMPIHSLDADTIRSGLKNKVIGAAKLLCGIGQGIRLVRNWKPDVIVGFGGYPSFPAVIAGQLCRVPTVLHEQNAVLGKANAILAALATKIALSLPPARALSRKAVVTGNPLRQEVAAIADLPYPAMTGDLDILVVGGSLGASLFSTVIPDAILSLPPEQRARIKLTQQVRLDALDSVRARYDLAGFPATLAPFFTDMPSRIATCHLFIGRSGASTVAEIAAAGRPAVFIPFPHHADRQQWHNAQKLVQAGGAWVIEEKDLTPETLASVLSGFITEQSRLKTAAMAAKSCGEGDAAIRLGDLVAGLAA